MSEKIKPSILIVEDEKDLRGFLADTLRANDYLVYEAEGGNEAWETIQQHSIDLLITDSAMPDGNGFQLIKRMDEASMAIPVLVLSGYLSLDETAAKKRGATAYLRKPATAPELLSSVESLLSLRAA